MDETIGRHSAKNPRILIVDDNAKNLQLLNKVLLDQGYRVIVAQDGAEALKAAEILPDLILLDIMMPEMDGFETCKKLKESPLTKDIPVIFLTAKNATEDIVKGFEVGAIDYVNKPFNFSELLARVKTHLQLKFSQETILKQESELSELIHILCHDLINPLGVIMNSLQLKIPNYIETQKETMLACCNQIYEIIKLVRELRAVTEGKKELQLSTLNLKTVLTESLKMLDHQFAQKNIEPILNISEDINVIAEKVSLVNTVFNNLLTNAIKFSHPNSQIRIDAQQNGEQAEGRPAEGRSIVVVIKDTGIGMPRTLLDRVFSVASPTTRKGTSGEKGTGFGMPLVKKFVSVYGGTIELSSKDESEFPDEHGTEVKLLLKIP